MVELKPCPFCGSEDITKHKYGVYRCENCGANVSFSKGVTLHGDLIDRDDLLAYFERKSKGKTAEEALKLLYTALKAYPTVIEKEGD
jgi:transposase-like protein